MLWLRQLQIGKIKCASCGGVLKEYEEIPDSLVKSQPQSLELFVEIEGEKVLCDDQNFFDFETKGEVFTTLLSQLKNARSVVAFIPPKRLSIPLKLGLEVSKKRL